MGWAEEADGCAEGVFEGGVAAGELFADAGGGLPGQPGVGHGVVADEMASGGDGAGEVGTLADEVPDEEEGGADLMAGEDFEKALGGGGVGAVVIGEGDLVGIRPGYDDLAEDLGLRPESGVGSSPSEKARRRKDGGCFGDGLWSGHGSYPVLQSAFSGAPPRGYFVYKLLFYNEIRVLFSPKSCKQMGYS